MNQQPSHPNPRVLIIGANGFVGSYLCDAFEKNGSNPIVRAFDRYTKEPQFNRQANTEVFKGDIFSDDDLRVALTGIDFVMHSFSATTPIMADHDPYKDITDNLQRSVRLFELCVEAGVTKIGFISSAGTVYGSATESAIASEDTAPLPVSPYGINKLSIEHYLEYFKRKFGLDYVVYRLTNPYGSRQVVKNQQGVIPAFIERVYKDEDLFVYGDGTSSRDYVFMQDAAEMISKSFFSECRDKVYNIGSGEQTSINELISVLARASNKTPNVTYNPAPKTFLVHSSISMARYWGEYGKPESTDFQTTMNNLYSQYVSS